MLGVRYQFGTRVHNVSVSVTLFDRSKAVTRDGNAVSYRIVKAYLSDGSTVHHIK